jgi:hypothetical protein
MAGYSLTDIAVATTMVEEIQGKRLQSLEDPYDNDNDKLQDREQHHQKATTKSTTATATPNRLESICRTTRNDPTSMEKKQHWHKSLSNHPR